VAKVVGFAQADGRFAQANLRQRLEAAENGVFAQADGN